MTVKRISRSRGLGLLVLGAGLFASGCASTWQESQRGPGIRLISNNTRHEACEPLGAVSARADCACYDKFSYELVRGQASRNLEQQAKALYPDSDLLEVSSIDLYLNNAQARGIAYRCNKTRG